MVNRTYACARLALLALATCCIATTSFSRDLTFEDRVKAQEAIERVYYSHQLGATRPFEEAVPRQVLEAKVLRYLQGSSALELLWHVPVTGEALDAELHRIARDTRLPGRLEEIYTALGHDGFLVRECFARESLVGRLARSFFQSDETIHAHTRAAAEALKTALVTGESGLAEDRANRRVVTLIKTNRAEARPASEKTLPSPVAGDHLTTGLRPPDLPETVGGIGEITDHGEFYQFQGVLSEDENTVQIADYSFPKTTWDDWWAQASSHLDASLIIPVADEDAALPSPTAMGDLADPPSVTPDNVWENGILDDPFGGRSGHTMFWTGSEVYIWGGAGSDYASGTRYDPLTDSWRSIPLTGAAFYYYMQTRPVWTGDEMIVLSGWSESGARYNPSTNAWTTIAHAPFNIYGCTAIWTGREVIAIPSADADGGRYDPATDAWRSISHDGMPAGRTGASVVWTGSKVIVWGGWSQGGLVSSGASYDPTHDIWRPLSAAGAPAPRSGHTAVWTGREMIVWGGRRGDGGIYDPSADSWRAVSQLGAPSARSESTAVWTGSEMIVWGGWTNYYQELDDGGRFDPAENVWRSLSRLTAPLARRGHAAVWTGQYMVVWGGQPHYWTYLATGGRYDPATDSWTPTRLPVGPEGRWRHSAVWTGNEMIIWGGSANPSESWQFNTGLRYNPLIDAWNATATGGAPPPRAQHSAVWSGDRMLVWGGTDFYFNEFLPGGVYDPVSDSWTGMLPGLRGRYDHVAVWTGREMLVWGGWNWWWPGTMFNSGGLYDPIAGTWRLISMDGAPSPRLYPAWAWTGQKLIVWGGEVELYLTAGDGAMYDPGTDTWTPMSPVGAPEPRWAAGTWGNDRFIVWGGAAFDPDTYETRRFNNGASYDPETDSWTSIPSSGCPLVPGGYQLHWIGNRMVAWMAGLPRLAGRYDPGTGRWIPTATDGAPDVGVGTSVIRAGSHLMVWGGLLNPYSRYPYLLARGGALRVTPSDDDADGYENAEDNCPITYNPDQADRDGDGTGDACSTCESVPAISCPEPAMVECAGPAGTPAMLGEAAAVDPCDPTPVVTSDAPPVFALGTTSVVWTATNESGRSATCTQQVTVRDTLPPDGYLTFPLDGNCFGPAAIPVTVTDDFVDACEGIVTRSYDPPGGPSYGSHGDYVVSVIASDSSQNSRGAMVRFTIDTVPPQVTLSPPPNGPLPVPSSQAFSDGFESSDDDGASGGVVHETLLLDGCNLYDGATYGDRDGLLSDERLTLDWRSLCRARALCHRDTWVDPIVHVIAADCAGNEGSAQHVASGVYQVDASICTGLPADLLELPVPDRTLAVSSDRRTIVWQTSTSAPGVYDAVRGPLSGLLSSCGFADATCLLRSAVVPQLVDASVPPAGDGYYYLVRTHGDIDGFGTGCSGQRIVMACLP